MHHHLLTDHNPHMYLHLNPISLGVVCLEVIPHPVYVLTLLANHHPLNDFTRHHHSKLYEVDPIRFC